MGSNRLVAEKDMPSAKSNMARARLARPAATLDRRKIARSSCRCLADTTTCCRPVRFDIAPSLFSKRPSFGLQRRQIVNCSPIYGEMYLGFTTSLLEVFLRNAGEA